MSRAAYIVAASVAVASLLPACMLFRSLDGLSSGAGDAGSDAAAGETSVSDGAGSDALEVDAGPYCASLSPKPRFCDDFDEETDLAPQWELPPSQVGSVSLDRTLAKSKPTSLLSVMSPSTDTCAYGCAIQRIAGTYRRAHVGFALQLGPNNPPERHPIAELDIGLISANDSCQIVVFGGPEGIALLEQRLTGGVVQPNSVFHEKTRSLPAGKWSRVEITEDYKTAMLSLRIDDAVVFSEPLATCSYAPGNVVVNVGHVCMSKPAAEYRANFDDVTIDAD